MKNPYYCQQVGVATYALMFRYVLKTGKPSCERIASGMSKRACEYAVKLHNEAYAKKESA